MKKITILVASLVIAVVFFSNNPLLIQASTSSSYDDAKVSIQSVTNIDDLNALIKYIKEQIKTLKKTKGNKSTLQNLSIDSITLGLPDGIGSGAGIAVGDQKITVVVKNNENGTAQLSNEKFKYTVYLYDVSSGKNKKLMEAATGEALIPYANGYSEFDVNFEGGMPFDGTNLEKEYQVEIQIDSDKEIKESNEKDNKKRSDAWEVTYYKG